MAYIILSIIGILAVLLLRHKWSINRQMFFIAILLIIGLMSIIGIDLFLFFKSGVIEKGIRSFFIEEIPWLEIVLYFIMIFGMASKYLFDAIGEGKRPKINKWKLLKPILVSPIIFGVVYGGLAKDSSPVLLLVFSFQNGFFWQTVLYKK